MSTITRRSVERWQLANGKLSLKAYKARRGRNTMPKKRVWSWAEIQQSRSPGLLRRALSYTGAAAAVAVRKFLPRRTAA